MRAILIATLCAFVAACASTPSDEQSPAGVEERKPSAGGPGTEAQPVDRKPIPKVDLAVAKPSMSPLKDPASILSRREVFFEFDKFDVRDEFKPLVEAHARYLRENPNAKMLIQGNADERGSREYNLALGQKRADAIKRMLLLLGAKEAQIESVSLGEEKPRATGHDEASWAQNRRGDMLYGGEY
jgi:peptidoglycan-associated lipoprotein